MIEVTDTIIAKHADYGQAASRPPALAPNITPVDAILSRLSDKFERLARLRSGAVAQVRSEKIADTTKDIIGYATLLHLEVEKEQRGKEKE
jgi:hypothetical protein